MPSLPLGRLPAVTARATHRRRRVLVALAGLGALGLLGLVLRTGGGSVAGWLAGQSRPGTGGPAPAWDQPLAPTPAASPPPSGADAGRSTLSATPASGVVPTVGPGIMRYDTSGGPVLGTAGPIKRFRVALESTVTQVNLSAFGAQVDLILGDGRSWIAGGTVRLQRVDPGQRYDFTIYLVTAATATRMCDAGGVPNTNNYTSCHTARRVILNLTRWLTSVPDYTKAHVPLGVYQAYMINHETGHELGFGHELCPGAGQPAPVMQQQTLGLHGCTANPWPYLDGKRYDGPLDLS